MGKAATVIRGYDKLALSFEINTFFPKLVSFEQNLIGAGSQVMKMWEREARAKEETRANCLSTTKDVG